MDNLEASNRFIELMNKGGPVPIAFNLKKVAQLENVRREGGKIVADVVLDFEQLKIELGRLK